MRLVSYSVEQVTGCMVNKIGSNTLIIVFPFVSNWVSSFVSDPQCRPDLGVLSAQMALKYLTQEVSKNKIHKYNYIS